MSFVWNISLDVFSVLALVVSPSSESLLTGTDDGSNVLDTTTVGLGSVAVQPPIPRLMGRTMEKPITRQSPLLYHIPCRVEQKSIDKSYTNL